MATSDRLRRLHCVGLSLLLFPSVAVAEPKKRPAPEPSAREIATRVQKVYDRIKTFKARFHQENRIRVYAKVKKADGSLAFAKPGKMSWRYSKNGNRVVCDGKTVKIYDADSKQYLEQPMDKNPYPGALVFLLGRGSLTRELELEKLDASDFARGYKLAGKPKRPTPAYETVVLYVDAATYQVRRIVLLDRQGNRNRFDFSGAVVNTKLDPAEFVFVRPRGARVVVP